MLCLCTFNDLCLSEELWLPSKLLSSSSTSSDIVDVCSRLSSGEGLISSKLPPLLLLLPPIRRLSLLKLAPSVSSVNDSSSLLSPQASSSSSSSISSSSISHSLSGWLRVMLLCRAGVDSGIEHSLWSDSTLVERLFFRIPLMPRGPESWRCSEASWQGGEGGGEPSLVLLRGTALSERRLECWCRGEKEKKTLLKNKKT